ncbi:hypothetical protein PVAP13_3NG174900 [Panicum virgatum]|uniref:Cupin type-1 domain-containing protein n=1 Tax=Panicum virgatum TaxID=38727 RepID=A0A8T0UCD8_PANVG|nr:hypothetical protein PVAP13_3NG174900 [Panicum virgatum]
MRHRSRALVAAARPPSAFPHRASCAAAASRCAASPVASYPNWKHIAGSRGGALWSPIRIGSKSPRHLKIVGLYPACCRRDFPRRGRSCQLCVPSCSTSAVTSSQSSFGAMAVDLTPRQPKKTYGGEGSAYYEWSPADLPMLGVASIGVAKLSLAVGSLSLPSYSDSAKVAYVLQVILLGRPATMNLSAARHASREQRRSAAKRTYGCSLQVGGHGAPSTMCAAMHPTRCQKQIGPAFLDPSLAAGPC